MAVKGKMNINVKITDNETGRVLFDDNGEGILGVFYKGEGNTTGILNGSFSNRTAFESCLVWRKIEETLEKRHPGLKRHLAFAELAGLDKVFSSTEVDMSALLQTE